MLPKYLKNSLLHFPNGFDRLMKRERLYEGLVRLVVAWISEIAHFTGMMIILSIEWRELQKDMARGRVEKVSERETRGKREKEARGNLTPEASWAWRHPEGAGYAAWIGRQEVGRRRWRRWRWCSQPVGVGLYSRPPCKASFLRIPLLSLSPPPFVFPHRLSFPLFYPPMSLAWSSFFLL